MARHDRNEYPWHIEGWESSLTRAIIPAKPLSKAARRKLAFIRLRRRVASWFDPGTVGLTILLLALMVVIFYWWSSP